MATIQESAEQRSHMGMILLMAYLIFLLLFGLLSFQLLPGGLRNTMRAKGMAQPSYDNIGLVLYLEKKGLEPSFLNDMDDVGRAAFALENTDEIPSENYLSFLINLYRFGLAVVMLALGFTLYVKNKVNRSNYLPRVLLLLVFFAMALEVNRGHSVMLLIATFFMTKSLILHWVLSVFIYFTGLTVVFTQSKEFQVKGRGKTLPA